MKKHIFLLSTLVLTFVGGLSSCQDDVPTSLPVERKGNPMSFSLDIMTRGMAITLDKLTSVSNFWLVVNTATDTIYSGTATYDGVAVHLINDSILMWPDDDQTTVTVTAIANGSAYEQDPFLYPCGEMDGNIVYAHMDGILPVSVTGFGDISDNPYYIDSNDIVLARSSKTFANSNRGNVTLSFKHILVGVRLFAKAKNSHYDYRFSTIMFAGKGRCAYDLNTPTETADYTILSLEDYTNRLQDSLAQWWDAEYYNAFFAVNPSLNEMVNDDNLQAIATFFMGEDEEDVLRFGAPLTLTPITYNGKPLQCFFVPGIQMGIMVNYSVWSGSSDGATGDEPELLAQGLQKMKMEIDLPNAGSMYNINMTLSGIDILIGGENEPGAEAD